MEFSEDFFRKEVRCGFEIPEMMKRAWAAEMEVLQVLIDICDRNGVRYFADCGTLLGAVRHQGFIPWDDDIDIALMRNEYMRLVKLLPKELPPGFAMTGMYADTERMRRAGWYTYTRVIADDTYWEYFDYMRRFHGFPYPRIGIDIFPIDYLPNDEQEREIIKEIVLYTCYTLENWGEYELNGGLDSRLEYIEKLCGVTIPQEGNVENFLWRLVDSASSLYNGEEADEVTDIYYWMQRPSYRPPYLIKKECYSDFVYLPFEQMQIAAPIDYEGVLSGIYNGDKDWRKYNTEQTGHTYPFYKRMEKKVMDMIRATGFKGTLEEFCRLIMDGSIIDKKGD